MVTWYGPRQAAARLGKRTRGLVRPDAELIVATAAGAVDLLVEWDRGTETLDRLEEKLRRYRMAERKVEWDNDGPRSVLFVVPGPRRLANLGGLWADLDRRGSWPILATTGADLSAVGALAPIWQRLDAHETPRRLIELPARTDLGELAPTFALGRRWRQDCPGFWERLSPLGRVPAADLRLSGIDGFMDDPEPEEEGSWR